MRLAGRLAAALALAAAALLSGCVSLPEVRYIGAVDAPAQPTVVSGSGKVSRARASMLLAKRLKASEADARDMAAREEVLTGSPLIAGNKVNLLFDGPQTMGAMMEAIRAARDHVNLETYIFDQDEVGLQFADLLVERSRAGIKVNVMYDSVGTLGTPQAFFDHLKEGGVNLVEFNPVNPLKLSKNWQLNQRDHRKVLIVDGKIGFTGGVNIDSSYLSSSPFRGGSASGGSGSGGSGFASRGNGTPKVGWRDTHVRIEGPAVAALQWSFLQSWGSQRPEQMPDGDFFPPLKETGDKLVRVLASAPGGDFDIYKAYVLAIREAKKSIHLTSAYFVPDQQILSALIQAARRGVDVRIVLPGKSDNGMVFRASQSFFDEMLEGGIHIHQLGQTVLHAKTAVIDGVWSTVGSTNIDTRSFVHNSEINVIVFGGEFGEAMEAAFAEDLRNSKEVTAADWKGRPITERVKEFAARMWEYWL